MSITVTKTGQRGNPNNYRVIKTARNLKAINAAIKEGYQVLVKAVEPSDKIQTKYALFRNLETKEIEMFVDAREVHRKKRNENYELIIDTTFYYPYTFESPFAAYIIPPDLKEGEMVFIEDLIEDYIGFSWNQKVSLRLQTCEAKWNGSELEILYTPKKVRRIMG